MKKQIYSILNLFLVLPPAIIFILRIANYYAVVYVNQEIFDESFLFLALLLTYGGPYYVSYVIIYYIIMIRHSNDKKTLLTYSLLFVILSVLSMLSILFLKNPPHHLDE